ncbi:ergothioneine biosynthesis protein EgtB [Wenzhouxiangella sp. 15181]|nr:ergothioneine biosynthesis protein EgtB [Wenzhouxiangella sp. 15181]RFP69396.1 ergothioneine biosynthesis protein EgtB [Wenzhouxiangella sp. 15190]
MRTRGTHRSNAVPLSNRQGIESLTREQLIEDFLAVRATTERLAEMLSPEDQNLQSMPCASPVKWHRAHTTWFFETFVIKPRNPNWRETDPTWRYLFNSYYNGVGDQYPRPQRGLISRPNVDEVDRYRRAVDDGMLALIENAANAQWTELTDIIRLGLNHEQQHQELIATDLKHGFSHNPMYPAWTECPPPCEGREPPLHWLGFDERIAEIGAMEDGCFCFDNEMPRHREVVEAFELASRPVTCGEFLAFMQDGGYDNPDLWLSDGWAWLRETGTRAPMYWQQDEGGQWWLYTLGGLRRVDPLETLAHVSFYEACAYAQWAGARLPTEAEWEIAATATTDRSGPFAEDGRFHPRAVNPDTPPDTAAGLFGNVWEWTASSYAPYPGFKAPPGAVGEYNGKFMANQMVLRGGSCATPEGHVRATYRNFFYPPDRWQFSGIRLARIR